MDNGDRNPPSGESEKQLPVSFPIPPSFVHASDMVTAEAYQTNLQQIQEAKKKIRMLEFNNESAHRNFLLDQLEKRAKDGREAENMLAQLRSQPGLPPAIQFTNNVSHDNTLPTTATLVEVSDSRSPSNSSSVPSVIPQLPQSVQQSRPANYQWSAPQISPYFSNFRYYTSPAQPTLHPQAPSDTGHRYAAQNSGFQATQAQQPVRSWIGYVPPVLAPPAPGVASGYYPSSSKTAPGHVPPSSSSPDLAFRGRSVSTQPVTFRPPVTTQPLNATSRVSYQSAPVIPVNPSETHSKPSESQPQPVSTTVPNPAVISELQRSRQLSEQLRQHQRQHQAHWFSQPQLQVPLQPSIQPQQHVRQSRQPPEPQHQPPPPLADRVHSSGAPQAHTQSRQVRDSLVMDPSPFVSRAQPHPTVVSEQARQHGTQVHQVDQATFIKQFQNAVQNGTLQTFWSRAKMSGVSEEWLRMAVNSVPQDILKAVLVQANKSGHIHNTMPPASAPQSQVSTIASSNATPAPLGQISTTQQASELSTSSKAHSAPGPPSGSYASQVQYYAQQATKSAHLVQSVGGISTSPQSNTTPAQITVTTPKRDVPQVTAHARTPKDANKSTLARDVLHALGKMAQNPSREKGGEPVDAVNNHENDELLEANLSRANSLASVEPPAALSEAVIVEADPLSASSAKPNAQGMAQDAISLSQSMAKPVLKAEQGNPAADGGPIMIDLTLDDESIDGKELELDFPMRTSTNPAIPLRPVAPVNTVNPTPVLEELTVVVAGDSCDVDVRMSSPPLAVVAEEDTGPQLVYPPPSRMEPVSEGFEPLPSERNEDRLDDQLPLFLPSPPASPVPTEPPATDLEIVTDEDEAGPPLKRHPIDVDNTQIDAEKMTPRVRKRRKQQVYVLIPPAPPYVKKAKMKGRIAEGGNSDFEGVGQDEELQYTPLEQLMIEESQSCLLERRCRWSHCGAILNSGANLLAHLRNHAREEASEAPFLCRWASCERQFGTQRERDVHLERHTTKPLPCPFAGCDKQFDKPVEVMQHEVQHQKTERGESLVRKPTGQPIVPAIPARLGLPPHRLPSHRVIPRRVAKCQISADRHAVVGPWVLWNIFSPVDLNMRKQNASMRGRPMRQANNYEVDHSDPRRDDYDFLLAISSTSAKDGQLDDLDSNEITMSAARGLTLWGVSGAETAVVSNEGQEGSSRTQSHEEDSVERMLSVT